MGDERYLTVGQAAARLQTSDEMIRRMLRDGRLAGFRLGGRRAGWRLPAGQLAALATAERRGPGRRPRRAATAPRDVTAALAHALAEAERYRAADDLALAELWERIAADIAARIAADGARPGS